LKAPSIATLFKVSQISKQLIYEGVGTSPTLRSFLSSKVNGLENELMLKISMDICSGIAYLHSLVPYVCHYNLCSNCIRVVSVDPNSTSSSVKIFESDISRVFDKSDELSSDSWKWEAPEILKSNCKQFVPACDCYSLGIVLWEIFSAPAIVYEQESTGYKTTRDLIDAVCKVNLRPAIPVDRQIDQEICNMYQSLVKPEMELRLSACKPNRFLLSY